MIEAFKTRLDEIKSHRPYDHKRLLTLVDEFLQEYPSGARSKVELDLTIELFRELVALTYLTSTREYENDHKLYREILQKKIRLFKRCIPIEIKQVRGLTELLMGMREDELG
jgi:hypothetical protein